MVGVVDLPEKVLKKLNKSILPEWKTCFYAAIIVGLLAHLYKITNWLPNWDSLVFRYDSQNMINIGRWFLPIVCSFTSFYDLPFLNGIVAILFHALGAVCICRTLNVHKKITAGLIGAVIVSFPTVVSVMMYNYVADGYSIAFFLSSLAAFYMTKEKPRYILSALFISLSIGIYQAYVTVTIMLILLKLIDETVFGNASFTAVLKRASMMLLSGVGGALIYAVALKVSLAVFSTELLDYQGINSTASLSNIDLLASLYVVKETFVDFFFDLSDGLSVHFVLNALVMTFTVVYYVKHIVCTRFYRRLVNLILVIAMAVMLTVGAGALAFVNPSVDYHNLMLMGYAVFYIFFILIYERGLEAKEKHTAIKCWSILVISVLLISNQILISNVSYHKAQIAYEKSYGTLIRIADRIEQTDGAESCDRILVVGALDDSEAYSVNLPPDITGITDGYIIRADDEIVGQSVFCSTINDYCGKNYRFVSGEEKKNLLKEERVQAMDKWPSASCVAVIDDTVIIKLGTEGDVN